MSSNRKLVLASTSPHRAKILQDNNIPFTARASDVEERIPAGATAAEAAMELGRQKCLAVYEQADKENEIVLGADTIVVSGSGEMLNKPKDINQAISYMAQRSGAVEEVITGFWICHPNGALGGSEISRITYSDIPQDVQEQIIASNEWQGVCGGLKVEGSIALYVKHIQGEYDNIRGLPIKRLSSIIEDLLAHQ